MRFFTILFILCGFCPVFAQNSAHLWTAAASTDSRTNVSDEQRVNKPTAFKAFALDFQAMNAVLREAPNERAVSMKNSPCLLELPLPDGSMEVFRVVESPILPEKLGKKYPMIHTFTAQSILHPAIFGKLDVGALGFHGFLFMDGGSFLIEPMTIGATDFYQVFDRKMLKNTRPAGTEVLFPENIYSDENLPSITTTERGGVLADPIGLRHFKFALSLTGEYYVLAGNTPATVMSAATNAVNRFNGIFERDFAMRFDFVDNVDTLFFSDANTDPFPANNVPLMAQNNKETIDLRIGLANYDVGHVFGKYLSGSILGIAGGGVCTENKAKAASTDTNPLADQFIVTVCQEIEHQFGASHTWNRCGDPSGPISNQFVAISAYEPGSGSTIVSYGGGCGSDDVAVADDYNHGFSIQQVKTSIIGGFAEACADIEVMANTPPSVTIPTQGGFYIPKSTPFKLTGNATDAEDQAAITYLWEEMDLGPQSILGQPMGTAPLMRSFPSTTKNTRWFPQISVVANNQTSKNEVLPTIDRVLNFRCNVLDNHPLAGGQAYAEIGFNCDASSGPFKVTDPNTSSVTWTAGEFRQVLWDVAGTNTGKVNSKKMNLLLSTAGGTAVPFATTLATNEENDGSAWVKVPQTTTTQARVMVEAADNIFYDMSNFNFKIENPTAQGFSTAPFPDAGRICLPTVFSTNFETSGLSGFAGGISFEVTSGLPSGATAVFQNSTVTAGNPAILNIDFPAGVAEGTYNVVITASSAGLPSIARTLSLVVVSNDFSSVKLKTPTDGQQGLDLLPTTKWGLAADANSYEWQLDETPAFNSPFLQTKTGLADSTSQPTTTLAESKQYFWRVRPSNECGVGAWVGPFSFATKSQSCQTLENTTSINIAAGGTPQIESKINMPQDATIGDVNVVKINGFHEFFKDLKGTLISPQGTSVVLWSAKCGSFNGNFKFGFDDQSALNYVCPPTDDQLHKVDPTAGNLLSNFNGQNAKGDWTLRINDNTSGSGGTLTGWKLELCISSSANPPILVNKNSITVQQGGNQGISNADLQATDPNNSASQLIFTIVTPTAHGDLKLNNGSPLAAGSTFTQADIDGGALRFYHNGSPSDDFFTFTVIDGEGGYIGTTKFPIYYTPVGTSDPKSAQLLDFQLVPNPANEQVTILFDGAATFDLVSPTGQILKNGLLSASGSTSVSLAGLPSSIYFVRLKNGSKTGVRRLVKQ